MEIYVSINITSINLIETNVTVTLTTVSGETHDYACVGYNFSS